MSATIRADKPYSRTSYEPSLSGPRDLHGTFNARALHWGQKHAAQSEIADVYYGNFPPEYDDFFPDEQHVHVVNMIRLGWDDQAGLAGQEFPLFFSPENETAAAKARAEKREHICYGYNAAGRKMGGVDMEGLSQILGWYLVGFGEAVLKVCPDYRRKTPFFDYRDPRTHFPPIGYSPWKQQALDETMFAYRTTLGELIARFPEKREELLRAMNVSITDMGARNTGTSFRSRFSRGKRKNQDPETTELWVGEFYSQDAWYVSTLEEKPVVLLGSEDGDKGHPGVCGVVAYSLFAADGPRSMLQDQISLQAAMTRMFSQKLDFYDKVLYPMIFTTPLLGDTLKYGPGALNYFDMSQLGTSGRPYVEVITPKSSVDADSAMQFTMGLQRILNRNPESMQGQGQADSAKALAELKGAISTTVQRTYWPSIKQGHPKLYSEAMRMDINIWGRDKKRMSGQTPATHPKERGIRKDVSYRPLQDLAGFEDEVEIEPGTLLDGYTGLLELMQLKGAGMLSLDTALERAQVIQDPEAEKRRIQTDQMEALIWADLNAKAQGGQLQPSAMADIRDLQQKDSMDLFDAVRQLREQGRLYIEAPAEEPGMPTSGAPGDMENIAASLANGAPSLELIQGGA